MTTETRQVVDKIYRNDKAPRVVIQTRDGNKYSCYDGSNVSDDIREGMSVAIPYKQNGQWNNISGQVVVRQTESWGTQEPETIHIRSDDEMAELPQALEEEVEIYSNIYKRLVARGVPESLANTSASTIYIQLKKNG